MASIGVFPIIAEKDRAALSMLIGSEKVAKNPPKRNRLSKSLASGKSEKKTGRFVGECIQTQSESRQAGNGRDLSLTAIQPFCPKVCLVSDIFPLIPSGPAVPHRFR